MKKMLIPLPPMPVPLKPTIVQKEGMLILASHEKVVESMFLAREKGKGLTATEEFQKLAAGIPQSGNAFRFIHPRFFRVLAGVQKSAMSMAPSGGEQGQTLRELFNFLQREWKFYGVVENTSEGMVMTFNHNLKLEYLLALPAVGVAGTAAAVAVPNLMRAADQAKQNATMADMRRIQTAIEMYIAENGKPPEGDSFDDLARALEPAYIQALPRKDGWGKEFHYRPGPLETYALGSAGRDGVFLGWQQKGSYPQASPEDFNNDIILEKGEFIYCPVTK